MEGGREGGRKEGMKKERFFLSYSQSISMFNGVK